MRGTNEMQHIVRDVGVIAASIGVAVLLAKSGVLVDILTSTEEWKWVGSVVAGFFFVSIFTAVPASVVLFEIAATSSMWEVAFLGAIGSVFGDMLIFRYIKGTIANDLHWLFRGMNHERLRAIFRRRPFGWLVPICGAIIIASPFPDEIGLAMMGLSRMRTSVFIPLVFVLDFLGILLIGFFAQ